MTEIELGTIIAVRLLDSAKLGRQVEVRIGAPRKDPLADFITPYQIFGVGDQKVRFAAGVDAIQSLQLVFNMIGAELFRLKEFGLKWEENDDVGFPTL